MLRVLNNRTRFQCVLVDPLIRNNIPGVPKIWYIYGDLGHGLERDIQGHSKINVIYYGFGKSGKFDLRIICDHDLKLIAFKVIQRSRS